MADNPPAAGAIQKNTSIESNVNNITHPTHRDGRDNSRGRNQRGRGRGKGQNRDRRGVGRSERDQRAGFKGFGFKKLGDASKRGEMGRGEWRSRNNLDKRQRNDEQQESKRRKIEAAGGDPDAVQPFSKEEIEAEERRPKRKVAVMIGYAGTGYKGMQINDQEKTIEGDIFKAFIAAGAISKANANDPKKSSLVRCARTDKGVHAAGNVISLKLIVEDPEIVSKINENLPPQIRVWGFERTNGGFSCYQTCDSRWYEYLIPTYSFIPPHPKSYLGAKLIESAEKEGYLEQYKGLQEDATSFWDQATEIYIRPILEKLDPAMIDIVMAAVHKEVDDAESKKEVDAVKIQKMASLPVEDETGKRDNQPSNNKNLEIQEVIQEEAQAEAPKSVLGTVESSIKQVKAAYVTAKKAYRISASRRARVQEALNHYLGTKNFHNYTIQKNFADASAKRVIKSFDVAPDPIIINDTEWLSMKVHGQSFMMHQIRKMVGMVALVVRCATPIERMDESYGPTRISIPKAPGLGLLLERPVFTTYNQRAVSELHRQIIDFDKFKTKMEDFKQREIYDRIFREEERDHHFHSFFHHLDHYKSEFFLWVTASGIPASKVGSAKGEMKKLKEESDNEVDLDGQEG